MNMSRMILLVGALILSTALVAGADDLTGGYVSPTSGDTSTVFTYYVYWCGTGDLPSVYVHIDEGAAVMMVYDCFVNGCHRFKFQTMLPAGDHGYYFTDSLDERDPDVGTKLGPSVS